MIDTTRDAKGFNVFDVKQIKDDLFELYKCVFFFFFLFFSRVSCPFPSFVSKLIYNTGDCTPSLPPTLSGTTSTNAWTPVTRS